MVIVTVTDTGILCYVIMLFLHVIWHSIASNLPYSHLTLC